MATSRGATPADPTLVATTTDSARGGLFNRSNIANTSGSSPATVTDVHLESVAFDDASRELTLTLTNGTSLTATIPGGGGTGPTTDTNDYIQNIRLTSNNQLEFIYNNSTIPNRFVDLSPIAGGITQAQVDALIAAAVADIQFTQLTDTPSSLGTANQQLRVNTAGDALEFFTPVASGIDETEFSSGNGTVVIEAGTGTNAGTVDLESRIRIFGNDSNTANTANSIPLNTQENFIAFTVSPLLTGPNGRPLTFVRAGAGIVELVESGAGTPIPTGPTETERVPSSTSFFDAPVNETVEIMISNGTVPDDPSRQPTATVVLTESDGTMRNITPDVTVNMDRDQVDVTIPSADGGSIGDYDITTTVPVNDNNGDPAPDLTVMDRYTRYVPFVQSRTELIDATSIMAGTESDAEFDATAGFTTITGSGPLYFAISRDQFSISGTRGRATVGVFTLQFIKTNTSPINITVGTTTIAYDTYQFGDIPSGMAVTNLRQA